MLNNEYQRINIRQWKKGSSETKSYQLHTLICIESNIIVIVDYKLVHSRGICYENLYHDGLFQGRFSIVGIENIIPVLKWPKTSRELDRPATVP